MKRNYKCQIHVELFYYFLAQIFFYFIFLLSIRSLMFLFHMSIHLSMFWSSLVLHIYKWHVCNFFFAHYLTVLFVYCVRARILLHKIKFYKVNVFVFHDTISSAFFFTHLCFCILRLANLKINHEEKKII